MNKRMSSFLFFAAFSFILWGCTGSQGEKADQEHVQNVITEFRAAVNSLNIDEILARYGEEAIILPDKNEMVIGKQAITEFWRQRSYASVELVENQVAFNSSGAIAYEVNKSTFKYQIEGQEPVVERPSKNVRIWQKQADGAWKLQVDVWNSSVAEQMEKADISRLFK